jgi:hypothetical protein
MGNMPEENKCNNLALYCLGLMLAMILKCEFNHAP